MDIGQMFDAIMATIYVICTIGCGVVLAIISHDAP